MAVEGGEQRLHRPVPRQRLAIQPQRGGVRHRILQPQTQEAHERQPVAHLVFHLFVGQVVQRLHHQCLEDQHRVPRLAPGGTPALRRWRAHRLPRQCRLELGAEAFPRNHRRQHHQRVLLPVQAFIPPAQIKKSQLAHRSSPPQRPAPFNQIPAASGKRNFSRCPSVMDEAVMDSIDSVRQKVNDIKHDPLDCDVEQDDYRKAVRIFEVFWGRTN
jgi:hypothetical protein